MDSNLIFAVAVELVKGRVFHVSDVTAGLGKVIDWRTVKSGDCLLDGADAYDVAVRLVGLVGWGAVAMALDAE